MNSLKIESNVRNESRKFNSEIQLELLKLHKPPQKSVPPPRGPSSSGWGWVWQILKLFSVCGSMDLHRQIGPGMRPKLIERKEGQRTSF